MFRFTSAVSCTLLALSAPLCLAFPASLPEDSANTTIVNRGAGSAIAAAMESGFIESFAINEANDEAATIPGWEGSTLQFNLPTPCCGISDYTCVTIYGHAPSGDPWAICYDSGDDDFLQEDADASDCLTNLHYVQSDQCITVAGSSCAYSGGIMNGYVAYLGGTQASQMGQGAMSGTAAGQWDISASESATIQSAINRFVGIVKYDLNMGVDFCTTTGVQGLGATVGSCIGVVGHQAGAC